jgi:hypothetical protein
MDIVGLLRKERAVLMGKVNAVDAALGLLGGGNAPQAKAKGSMSDEDRRRRNAAMKAFWRKRRQHKRRSNLVEQSEGSALATQSMVLSNIFGIKQLVTHNGVHCF